MKFGNNRNLIIVFSFFFVFPLQSEDKIISTPLLNIENIKPSFEETDIQIDEQKKIEINNQSIKKKNQMTYLDLLKHL